MGSKGIRWSLGLFGQADGSMLRRYESLCGRSTCILDLVRDHTRADIWKGGQLEPRIGISGFVIELWNAEVETDHVQ